MTARAIPAKVKLPIDIVLFGATLALVTFGLLMVMDSSYVKTLDSARAGFDAYSYLKRQFVGAVAGMAGMAFILRLGYWKLRNLALPLMGVGLVLLIAVYIPHIGIHENGAARWVKIGMRFEPSELAKLTLLLYLAALLSRPDCRISHLTEGLGPPLLVVGAYLLLIEREPDLGTAFVLFLAVLTQLFLAGARKRHIAMICMVALLGVVVMGMVFKHRQDRISAFLHPERDKQGIGYQIYHSRLAVGSGEIFGVGLGQGREKFFLPQSESDFIFATMAEELGFLRVTVVLALLCIVGWRGFQIARRARDRFAQLLAAGIAALISWQALVNIAVATASIPATGVPLPFISFGSTSLFISLIEIGLLLSIAQYPQPPANAVARSR